MSCNVKELHNQESKDDEPVTRVSYESLEALGKAATIKTDVESEVAGVNILITECGKVYLYSKDGKTVPKKAHVGGYGTGMYVCDADPSKGIPFEIKGDRDLVEVDATSLDPSKSGFESNTFYGLLVQLEAAHGVTDHSVTWLKVSREQKGGTDKFNVETQTKMKYKLVSEVPELDPEGEKPKKKRKTDKPPEEKKITSKSAFGQCLDVIKNSDALVTAFRFRYDKIHKALRPQKPYVVAGRTLKLEAGKPFQV